MADSHPFANAGLGMFGSAENAFAKGSMQGSDKKDGLLGKAAGALLDASGIKDFLDKNFGGNDEGSQPTGSVAPTSSAYGLQPAVPISQQGISPMRLPNALPNGVGLNATPAGAMNPFQFQINPQPSGLPDDEHRNQVKSAWS
jgi:hypothetical protein